MNEAIGYARRITRGIEVNEDTLAVDVINRVGPNGHYLKDEHTRKYYKSEYWLPSLIDRSSFEDWKMMGEKSFKDRTVAKVQDMLANYEQVPLKPETEELIETSSRRG